MNVMCTVPQFDSSEKLEKDRLANQQQQNESNPFNRIATKHFRNAVLGQRIKGSVKRPGHSISRAIENRKKSLLKEFEAVENNKFNAFVDKRYEATLEAKLNDESQKIKNKKQVNKDKRKIENMMNKINNQRAIKSMKKQSFNIDNETEMTLTHLGKAITDESLKK